MPRISRRGVKIEVSGTMHVKEKALHLQRQGVEVIDLTAGEPDFQTPDHIRQAGIQAIEEGKTKYTANAGIPELRQAIVEKFRKENQLKYDVSQILVSSGAKQSIVNAMLSLVESGDEVLIPAPYWVSYPQQVRLSDATPVILDTSRTHFKLTPEVLEQHLSLKTRLLIFNTPVNPTGIVYTEADIRALAEVLIDRDIWVISDEIYEHVIFDGIEHFSISRIPGMYEKTVVINGVSKAYAMTGWRIGYAAGPPDIIKAMSKIQGHTTSNASTISQWAALAALQGPQDCINRFRKIFQDRRDFVMGILKQNPAIPYIHPQGAFYVFIDVSRVFGNSIEDRIITNALDFCSYLIDKYRVVVVPGDAFGAPGFIRVSIAASKENLRKGILSILDAVTNLES